MHRDRAGRTEDLELFRVAPENYPAASEISQTTVLVVDDEALIRWSVGERLRAEGYEVLEAPDGRLALELIARGVDVVLLDAKLPDIGGVAVLRHLTDRDPGIRVILLTVDGGMQPLAGMRIDSRLPCANKPFVLDDLVSLVKRTAT